MDVLSCLEKGTSKLTITKLSSDTPAYVRAREQEIELMDLVKIGQQVKELRKAVEWMKSIGEYFRYKAPEQIDSCNLVSSMYATAEHALSVSKDSQANQQMQWVSVADRLPENKVGKYKVADFTVVLCTDGKQWYKSYYVKHHEIDCEDMSYEGDGEYDEKTDTYYWPEGWYECSSENEEIDWVLGAIITHWMPLPEPPKGEE